MTSGRNVTVTLTKTVKPANWLRAKRFQGWRWTAQAENGETLAISSEAYTNRRDAEDAITLLFGCGSSVTVVCGSQQWAAR